MRHLITLILFLLAFYSQHPGYAASNLADVPRDHWAYEAIRFLVDRGYMDGYSDDTFRGNRAVDRYEMAVTVARIVMKMREIETSGSIIDEEEAATIRKLMTEFRDELKAIGIRIDGIENRLKKLEDDQRALSQKTSTITLNGSYSAVQHYNDEAIVADGYDDNNPGLSYMRQSLNLYLTVKPDDGTEVFVGGNVKVTKPNEPHYINIKDGNFSTTTTEVLTGVSLVDSTLEVALPSGTGIALKPGTTIVENKTIVSNTRLKTGSYRLSEGHRNLYLPNEMHLKTSGSDYAKFRYFAGEGFTGTDDPARMLAMDYEWDAAEPWAAYGEVYSGVEVDGKISDTTTYFTSYLKQPNGSPVDAADTYALRLRYTVPKNVLENASMTVGGTYTEHIRDYNSYGDFHRNTGLDINYNLNKSYTLNVIGQQLWMLTGNPQKNGYMQRSGLKLDFKYGYKDLKSDLNFYRYDPDFVIYTGHARNYFMFYRTWYDDYYEGRPETSDYSFYSPEGERHIRWKTTYNYKISDDAKLNVEGLIDRMWWDRKNTEDENDYTNYVGHFYQIRVWPTWSSKISGEMQAFRHLDPKKDETGKLKARARISALINPNNNGRANMEVWTLRDGDDLDDEENAFRETWIGADYGYNASDKLFLKMWSNINHYDIGREEDDSVVETGGSSSWSLTDSLQFDGLYKEYRYKGAGTWKRLWKYVFEKQFSKELKGRTGYWFQRYQNQSTKQHFHFDFNYTASAKTRVQLTLSPPTDAWGNSYFDGDGDNVETVKKVRLLLKTSF